MAEYWIVAGLDPQTTAGANKVRQDLRGIQTEAKATQTALDRSFDQARFERTVGGLISSLSKLDATMGSLSKNTTAQGRAAAGAADSNTKLESALRRVLAATDAEASEMLRLNTLLADSKRLLDAGMISQEQYARVQKLVTDQGRSNTQVMGAQRIGVQQLGFQLGDVVTMWSLGAKPAQIFASQVGQVVQAVQLMTGGTSAFASFLQGPWGIGLTLGVIALAPFLGKLLDTNTALDDAVDKLKKDAAETETTRQAKERFKTTEEGVTAAINDQKEALDKQEKSLKTEAERNLEAAQANLQREIQIRRTTKALLEQAIAQEKVEQTRSQAPGQRGEIASLGLEQAASRVAALQDQVAAEAAEITKAQQNLTRAQSFLDVERGSRDPAERIRAQYEGANGLIEQARQRAIAEGKVGDALQRQVQIIKAAEEAAIRQAQAETRATQGAGVPSFASRQQAIGIAGRELQQAGLRVGENVQFGGVHANHPGMGNAAHGQFAIDVNAGSGVEEANVPNLRTQFDGMARRYQARGFRVLWNGWVYEAGGNGPTSRIPAGQHQHHDHMHLEAPGTIVGKPTQASAEAQARQEEQESQRREARAADFVQEIVDRASTVGLPANRKTQLASDIDAAFAEFQRRFDRAPDFAEKWKIATALSEADARAQSEHFRQAYVEPLDEWLKLEGTAGLQREIRARQLDEERRKGEELSNVDKAQIENYVRMNDMRQREQAILESVQGPLDDYRQTVAALNDLLAKGAISQEQFNARMADLRAPASKFTAGLSGTNQDGVSFADQAARDEAARQRDLQLAQLQDFLDQGTILEQDAASIRLAIWRDYNSKLMEIDQARKDQQLADAQTIAQSLLQITETTIGKSNALWKGLFIVEKAIAIARSIVAIQTGVAQAAALPFPANLGAMASVAAAGASIISNIAAVAVNFRDGGWVHGPGGPRDDRVPARVSNGEFIVRADAARRNASLLEAINSGQSVRAARQASDPGAREGAVRGRVQVHNYAGAEVETRENLTTGDVEIIVGRAIARQTPKVVASQLKDPSSQISKSLKTSTTARPVVT